MKCVRGYEVGVHRSHAGFYKGTVDADGSANCRISGYTNTAEAAENLPFTRMNNVENRHCNGCGNCFSNK